MQSGHDIYDLGESLYGFLLRYGDEFDYGTEAVSVASGGIVPKSALGFTVESSRWSGGANAGAYGGVEDRLVVDDPLTGALVWLHGWQHK